jgi:hypothetical protein
MRGGAGRNMHDPAIQHTAHKLIDGGVDIIHGGSSHHLLGVEVRNQLFAPFYTKNRTFAKTGSGQT